MGWQLADINTAVSTGQQPSRKDVDAGLDIVPIGLPLGAAAGTKTVVQIFTHGYQFGHYYPLPHNVDRAAKALRLPSSNNRGAEQPGGQPVGSNGRRRAAQLDPGGAGWLMPSIGRGLIVAQDWRFSPALMGGWSGGICGRVDSWCRWMGVHAVGSRASSGWFVSR